MKKNLIKSMAFAIAAILLCTLQSCTEEFSFRHVKDGLPAKINLKVTVPSATSVINTRAAEDVESEVKDLWLVMFSNQNPRIEIIDLTGLVSSEVSGDNNGYRTYTFDITGITTKTGNYTAYLLANATSNFCGLTLEALQAVTTPDDFEALMATAAEKIQISGTNRIPMVAKIADAVVIQSDSKTVTISATLERLMSRIEFYFQNGKDDSGNDKCEFTPQSYRVYNLPKKASLTTKKKLENAKDEHYFNVTTPQLIDENDFSFLMLENVQDNVENGVSSFADREIWNIPEGITKPTDGETTGTAIDPADKVFTHAPTYSTYVVVTGNYQDATYSGTVNYTIHLGDFSTGSTNDGHGWGNFTVGRNELHKYRITVNGVGSITAEANIQDIGAHGTNPGAEGTLFKSANNFVLDAHYEAVIMTLTQEQITGIKNRWSSNTTTIGVSCPFNNYTYTIYKQGDTEVDGKTIKGYGFLENESFDYTWIQIMQPKAKGVIPRFPGYKYTANGSTLSPVMDTRSYGAGGTYSDRMTLNQTYPTKYWKPTESKGVITGYTEENITYNQEYEDYYGPGVACKIGYLNDFCADPESYCFQYTEGDNTYYQICVFVDEFVYGRSNPKNGGALPTKDWVNRGENRTIILNPTTINVSPDNQSTVYNDFVFSIQQRSIKTTYDVDDLDDASGLFTSAFGIETWDETAISGSVKGTKEYESVGSAQTIYFKKIGSSGTAVIDHIDYAASDANDNESYDEVNGRANTLALHATNKTPDNFWCYAGYNKASVDNSAESHAWNYPLDGSAPGINAIQAMMLRNRDLNGNAQLDNNEIRWYLPAMAQLYTIWLGQTGLPGDTRLMDLSAFYSTTYYGSESLENKFPKFFTSTGGKKIVYWQDQGISLSTRGQLGVDWFQPYHYARAVRNIPDFDVAAEFPVDYSYLSSDNVVCIRGIAEEFLRSYEFTDHYYPYHTEREEYNQLPEAFEISENEYTINNAGRLNRKTYTSNTESTLTSNLADIYNSITLSGKDAGKSGWRIPNQRELMILGRAGKLTSDEYIAYFCGTWYTKEWKGYPTTYRWGFFQLDDNVDINWTWKVRLVRDVNIARYPQK